MGAHKPITRTCISNPARSAADHLHRAADTLDYLPPLPPRKPDGWSEPNHTYLRIYCFNRFA